jgi:peptidoglycan/LPS O-acetylase OafA/YrhL
MCPSDSPVATGPVIGLLLGRELPQARPRVGRPSIDSLTSLRGIASVWVALYHFTPDLNTLLPGARFLSPFLSQGHFAVPIFFVLSGFVLTYNYLELMGTRLNRSELFKFWGRRLLRIYPLHFATLFAVLAMVIVARVLGLTISREGYGWRDFALNLFLIQTWVPHFHLNWNYPSWSISSEWFAYLFFPLVCLGLIRVQRASILAGLALISFGLSIGLMWAGSRLPFKEMTAVIGPFLLGCTFARAIDLGYFPRSGLKAGAWALVLILVLSPYFANGQAVSMAMVTSGLALVYVLGASGGGCSRFWLWEPLVILGEVSYSLYLTHTIVQKLLYEIAPTARFADRSLAVRLGLLVVYAATIAVATLIAHACVEVYFRKSLRRRFTL